MSLQSQRAIGAVMAIVAVLTLVIALLVQPIGEWGAWGLVIGAVALLFVFIGLVAVVSKNPNMLMGRRYNQGSYKWTLIAVIFVGIALVAMLASGFIAGWTAVTVLQLGTFAALECMLVGSWLATRSQ